MRFSLNAGPAICSPTGRPSDSPFGIEIAGPAFSENGLLDASHALEQQIGFDVTGAFA